MRRKMKRCFVYTICVILAGGLLVWTGTSQALTFSGSSGTLAASADFELSGSTLTILLTNTSTFDVLVPSDVLMGLFFDTTHVLTPVSASLGGSSSFSYGTTSSPGDGWQYKSGVSAQGKNGGISAAGFGVFGPDGNFSATPLKLGGLDYGILSAGDNSGTGNTGVTGKGPLIKNSIVFTLTAASGFALTELGDTVVFQYGTALTEPNVPGRPPVVPEPITLLLLGAGLVSIAGVSRKFRK